MTEVFGIDVSHYQGRIDWAKVRESGVKFAILKCMYEAQSHRIDEQFEANYAGCKQNGIAVGVYIFIGSQSIKDPDADALALLGHLRGRHLDYGIWLDYESDALRATGGTNIHWMTEIYVDYFKAAGYYVGIYCNQDWYKNVISARTRLCYDFWIARYPKNDQGKYNKLSLLRPSGARVSAWQYSSKGKVPGINTNVDLDVDYDGVLSLIADKSYHRTYEEIAKEVIEGKWGTKNTIPSRKTLLKRAGYDYQKVQDIVNEMLKA